MIDDAEAFGYRVFTTDFDEEVAAKSLMPPEELAKLASEFHAWTDRHVAPEAADTLAEMLAASTAGQSLAVTLLLDNSGSLRGPAAGLLAGTADLLARALEQQGAALEVLGYTTAQWKGGRARAQWLDTGQPPMPGRLNDRRHIVYADFATPWRTARRNIALFLNDGLRKENFDGEALVWAYQRLLQRTESRRVLVMFTDGAPVDDSTYCANANWYLQRHLVHVIDEIEERGLVELAAVGIGVVPLRDVEYYYGASCTITFGPSSGGTPTEQLAGLFKRKLA